jgi:DNA-binding NtrC family response regulator
VHDLLVVEDKASLRVMLCKTLVGAGYHVDEAATGSDAVARLAQRRYLAVLCDLKLPGADGFEVLRAALDADPSVPVVLMTAYGTIEDAVRAMKAGAFDFLRSRSIRTTFSSWLSGRSPSAGSCSRTCC